MFLEILPFIIAFLLPLCVVLYLKRKAQPSIDAARDNLNRLNSLPLSEVKEAVISRLEGEWEVTPADAPATRFSPIANDFFSRYQTIEHPGGGVRVILEEVQPMPEKNYLCLGRHQDGDACFLNTEDDSIIANCADEGERLPDGMRFTSIYHYLLFHMELAESE